MTADLIVAIVSGVISAAGSAGAVWRHLTGKLDRLEDRVAAQDADLRVLDVKLAGLESAVGDKFDRLEKAVTVMATKLDRHMDDEPRQLRDIMSAELARYFTPHLPPASPPDSGPNRRPGS